MSTKKYRIRLTTDEQQNSRLGLTGCTNRPIILLMSDESGE